MIGLNADDARYRRRVTGARPGKLVYATRQYLFPVHCSSSPLSPTTIPTTPLLQAMDTSDGVLSSPATLSQTPARARQQSALNSSIWAPQPQIIDTTWPRAIDTYAQTASALADSDFAVGQGREYVVEQTRLKQGLTPATNLSPITREDVFGPVGGAVGGGGVPRSSVGAIGDGRQKASPRFEDIVRSMLFAVAKPHI